jgi:hypothetical protein
VTRPKIGSIFEYEKRLFQVLGHVEKWSCVVELPFDPTALNQRPVGAWIDTQSTAVPKCFAFKCVKKLTPALKVFFIHPKHFVALSRAEQKEHASRALPLGTWKRFQNIRSNALSLAEAIQSEPTLKQMQETGLFGFWKGEMHEPTRLKAERMGNELLRRLIHEPLNTERLLRNFDVQIRKTFSFDADQRDDFDSVIRRILAGTQRQALKT